MIGVQIGDRAVAVQGLDEGVEGLAVSTAGLRRQSTGSEEDLHRPRHRRDMAHRMTR